MKHERIVCEHVVCKPGELSFEDGWYSAGLVRASSRFSGVVPKGVLFPFPKHLEVDDINVNRLDASVDIFTNMLRQYGVDLSAEYKDSTGFNTRFARPFDGLPPWFMLLSWSQEAQDKFWKELIKVYNEAEPKVIQGWFKHGKGALKKDMAKGPGILVFSFPTTLRFNTDDEVYKNVLKLSYALWISEAGSVMFKDNVIVDAIK